jgi:alpha-tubulin suppressor-like RCC1 family protein
VRGLSTALVFVACTTPFDEALLGTEPCGDACVESCEGQPEDTRCPGGACHEGACCRGCWDGASCHAGDADLVCGREGRACAACVTPADRCSGGRCVAGDPAIALSSADVHSCVITESHALFCWGSDVNGALGSDAVADGSFTGEPARVEGAWTRVVAAGGSSEPHTCAIADAGTISCWGTNGNAELGTGDDVSRSTPSPILDAGPWIDVAASQAMSCGLRSAGELVCWGYASDPFRFGFANPTFEELTAAPFSERFRTIVMRAGHSCAIDAAGTLYCAGDSDRGRLGHESGNDLAIVSPGSRWSAVSVGLDHTCGVASDGTLWCWGANDAGQLGRDGAAAATREQVGTDSDWSAVVAGDRFSCALEREGRAFCWGDNVDGQLGDGGTASRSSLAEVTGGLRFRAIAAGGDHACAIGEDGVVYCWGDAHGSIGEPRPTAVTLAR